MNSIEINTEIQQLITSQQAWFYKIVPKEGCGQELIFYTNNSSEDLKEELELVTGKKISLLKIEENVLLNALSRYYRSYDNTSLNGKVCAFEGDIDDFLSRIIRESHLAKSSDIHIEPLEARCRIRIRIDGKLVEKYSLKSNEYPGLLNKIKVKSNLDIAEKRLPQDGRMVFAMETVKFDIRVSTLPSIYGEKVVMRLLSNSTTNIDIRNLGFSEVQLQHYLNGIKRNQGIILISGPTGSGKTTTLYATLKILNNSESNIITIEDPVEYTLEGINQVQLNEGIGLSFSRALRTFLRQDPDIIMIGEIRDVDTAQIAIRAALTGHLVLSTVHTNSAWGTISRLIDMGIASYNLADTMVLSVAQRLIRLLCPECKKQDSDAAEKLPLFLNKNISTKTIFMPVGCPQCHFTGFNGRKALYEVLPIDKTLSNCIKKQDSDIDEYMKNIGVSKLSELAMEALMSGFTSVEEVLPILLSEDKGDV